MSEITSRHVIQHYKENGITKTTAMKMLKEDIRFFDALVELDELGIFAIDDEIKWYVIKRGWVENIPNKSDEMILYMLQHGGLSIVKEPSTQRVYKTMDANILKNIIFGNDNYDGYERDNLIISSILDPYGITLNDEIVEMLVDIDKYTDVPRVRFYIQNRTKKAIEKNVQYFCDNCGTTEFEPWLINGDRLTEEQWDRIFKAISNNSPNVFYVYSKNLTKQVIYGNIPDKYIDSVFESVGRLIGFLDGGPGETSLKFDGKLTKRYLDVVYKKKFPNGFPKHYEKSDMILSIGDVFKHSSDKTDAIKAYPELFKLIVQPTVVETCAYIEADPFNIRYLSSPPEKAMIKAMEMNPAVFGLIRCPTKKVCEMAGASNEYFLSRKYPSDKYFVYGTFYINREAVSFSRCIDGTDMDRFLALPIMGFLNGECSKKMKVEDVAIYKPITKEEINTLNKFGRLVMPQCAGSVAIGEEDIKCMKDIYKKKEKKK